MPKLDRSAKGDLGEVSKLLANLRQGDDQVQERLFDLVYHQLKRIARKQLRSLDAGETLRTTALVHEAYLRLARPRDEDYQNRLHFLAVAARAMRQIIVDHLRAAAAGKRGDGQRPLRLDALQLAGEPPRDLSLLVLDAALHDLERFDQRLGKVVELRFFGGLTVEEVGQVLGIAERTVKRDWRRARAFLQMRLGDCVA